MAGANSLRALPPPERPRPDRPRPALPRRTVPIPPDLLHAIEYARILRAAGDAGGAARVLDVAFAAEGTRTRFASERVRLRALLLRADLAMLLHDDVGAARFLADAQALSVLAEALAALDEGRQDPVSTPDVGVNVSSKRRRGGARQA